MYHCRRGEGRGLGGGRGTGCGAAYHLPGRPPVDAVEAALALDDRGADAEDLGGGVDPLVKEVRQLLPVEDDVLLAGLARGLGGVAFAPGGGRRVAGGKQPGAKLRGRSSCGKGVGGGGGSSVSPLVGGRGAQCGRGGVVGGEWLIEKGGGGGRRGRQGKSRGGGGGGGDE